MKALSIKQPWADLVLGHIKARDMGGVKDIENRTWSTHYRGKLLIHAGKSIDRAALEHFGIYAAQSDRLGVILGMVDLIDVVSNHPSPWAQPDCMHWVLANPVRFNKPIPFKGALGLFNVPDHLILNGSEG